MLSFQPIQIEDKKRLEPYLRFRNFHMCEHSFVDLFIWRDTYDTRWCVEDDLLYLAQFNAGEPGRPIYFPPLGMGDIRTGVERVRQDAEKRGAPLVFGAVPEEVKVQWETLFPGRFSYEERRNGADYVYLAERLITLQGKKLHAKRNFINRFKAAYPGRWRYEAMRPDQVEEVMAYHQHWCALNHAENDPSFRQETRAIVHALLNFEALGLSGGILWLDERIIAFTLGAQSAEDMFVIQIEKADHTVPGAYPMINQQFAAHVCTGVQYINREDDLGLEGLRKAKLSYDPVFLTKKYRVVAV